MSVEYCCFVRNLTQHDARMQERLTMRRAELELQVDQLKIEQV